MKTPIKYFDTSGVGIGRETCDRCNGRALGHSGSHSGSRLMGPRYTARRRERSMRAVPDDGGDAPRTLRRSDMLGASACDDGRPVWTSLLPSAKMELAHNDSSRDILKLAPGALSAEDRRLVEDVASCASALAVPQPTQARSITPAADSQLARLLRNLTARLGGLPDGRRRFHWNAGATDPGVFTSAPVGVRFRSGGPCPLHQDYHPQGKLANARCLTFSMLLQDTDATLGPTYIYPGSRQLQGKKRATAGGFKPRGRPPKKTVATETLSAELNPQSLARDLERNVGPPVLLTGKRLTIFRSESSEWHGALANHGDICRSILIWSYCTSTLRGKMKISVRD